MGNRSSKDKAGADGRVTPAESSDAFPLPLRAEITRRQSVALLASGCAALLPGRAFAAAADFYQGKTIEAIIGYPPGASNDIYARRIAEHLPRFIPGHPNIVPRNMPGAGSLTAAAYMYHKAARDGTAMGVTAPTLPLDERLGSLGDRVKPSQFAWIGRVNTVDLVIFVRPDSLKTIDEAFTKVASLSATGAGSALTIDPYALNHIVGTRFKLIMGYKGSAEGMLAVDRHEVDGHCTGWDTLKTAHPDWIKTGKVRVLVQFSLHRHPDLPNVPTAVEVAKTPRQVELMKAVVSSADIGISFYAAPGTPTERLSVLRTAFTQCMKDPAFIADVKKLNLGFSPLSGEDLTKLGADLKNIPDELIPDLKLAYSASTSKK